MNVNRIIAHLALPPDACSPNFHGHWRSRYKATKSYREQSHIEFLWLARGCRWPEGLSVTLDVEYNCCKSAVGYKPRDIANAMAALKPAIDGMADAEIVKSDAKQWVQWGEFTLRTTAPELKRAGVVPGVIITVNRQE